MRTKTTTTTVTSRRRGDLVFLLIIFQSLFSIPRAFALQKPLHLSAAGLPSIMTSSPPSSALLSSTATSVSGGGGGEQPDTKKKKKSVDEIQQDALSNISNCYKLATLAGIVGVGSVFWETSQRNYAAGITTGGRFLNLNVKEKGDLLVHLFDFVFASGLHQAYQLFQKARGVDRMSPPNQFQLSQTLCRLWLGVTIFLSLDGIGLAYDNLNFGPILKITIALFVVNIPLGEWYHRNSVQQESPLPEAAGEYEPARNVGLQACRNMIWTVGTLALGGIIEVVQYCIQTHDAKSMEDKAGIVIGGLLDASESFIITGLLASLYKTLLRAVITSTKRNFNGNDPAFVEYFEAQSKFYGRVSSFFGFQVLFTILGYVAQVGEKLWFKYVG